MPSHQSSRSHGDMYSWRVALKNINRTHDRECFYKYMTAETARIVLATNSIRFSSPDNFNDPFDVVRDVRLGFSYSDLYKQINNLAYDICENQDALRDYLSPNFLTLCEVFRLMPRWHRENRKNSRIDEGEARKLFATLQASNELKVIWEKIVKSNRILSLTEDNDNEVMWAHYADNYKGVVLELECLDVYDSPLLVAEKVKYSNNDITFGAIADWVSFITGFNAFDRSRLYKDLELTKKENWSYENEWRIITSDNSSTAQYTDINLHPSTFSKIFLGAKIREEDRNDLLLLAHNRKRKIDVFNSVINQSNRRIEFAPLK